MYKNYLREIKALFSSKNYPKSDLEDVVMHLLSINFTDLHTRVQLNNEQKNALESMIDRRLNGEPVAHIIGYKEFLGRNFKVTSNTLIPRPETEILVNEVIKRCQEKDSIKILDIGTGTGCIIISIIKELEKLGHKASGIAIDISDGALEVAKHNAETLGMSDKIKFINCDVRKFRERDFNLVVSNPPYIPSSNIPLLETSVKDYEPHIALDGGSDGLDFYRDIAKLASEIDCCILEFGIGQSEVILEIFNNFKEKKVIKDLKNIERVIICENS